MDMTPNSGCLMLFDTVLEAKNEIGRLYTFPPMEFGECSIHFKMQEILGVQIGDIAYFYIDMPVQLLAMIYKFNNYALLNNKMPVD